MLTRRDPVPLPVGTIGRGAMLSNPTNFLASSEIKPTPPPLVGMRMRNIDVVVRFEDGSHVVLLAQARHPLRAVQAVISEAERTLTAEQLLSIKSMEFR